MKKLVYVFIALFVVIGIVSCSSSKTHAKNQSIVQGSWKRIVEGDIPVGWKQLKHYTEKNFVWHTMNEAGIIMVAGAGEYRLIGDDLYEEVDMTTYVNRDFKGRTAKIKIEIKNDTMIQNTVIQMANMENIFTEKWVRIK